jgi:hypothetical protein
MNATQQERKGQRMRIAICAFTLIAATAISALGDDVTMTSKITLADGTTSTAVSYLSKDRVLMAHGNGQESMIEAATGQMTSIDTKKKTYYVTTREDLERIIAMMQTQMNSPEMKRAQRGMSADSDADMFSFNVRKTGASRKIAGLNCEVWSVTVGEVSNTEECMTNDLAFPPQIWEMYRKYSAQMSSGLASMAASGAKMQAKMRDIKGYPLSTRTTLNIMGHKTVVGTEVTDIRHGSIPSSAWAIPAGYTKVDNPMLKALARKRS